MFILTIMIISLTSCFIYEFMTDGNYVEIKLYEGEGGQPAAYRSIIVRIQPISGINWVITLSINQYIPLNKLSEYINLLFEEYQQCGSGQYQLTTWTNTQWDIFTTPSLGSQLIYYTSDSDSYISILNTPIPDFIECGFNNYYLGCISGICALENLTSGVQQLYSDQKCKYGIINTLQCMNQYNETKRLIENTYLNEIKEQTFIYNRNVTLINRIIKSLVYFWTFIGLLTFVMKLSFMDFLYKDMKWENPDFQKILNDFS